MGQYRMLAYAELWDIDLIGVVDIDRDRAKQVAAYRHPAAVRPPRADRQVDLASVAVPTEQHFQVAADLLEPASAFSSEADHPRSKARELFAIAAGRAVLHVGRRAFNGAVQELKKIVERPILIESRRLGPFAPRVQKDSVVMDLMIHDRHRAGPGRLAPRRLTRWGRRSTPPRPTSPTCRSASSRHDRPHHRESRHREKIRVLAVTQPEAYVVLDLLRARHPHPPSRRAEYTLNRESIRYRRASFVEHVQVHKDNPLKLEVLHLVRAVRRSRGGEKVVLAETEDVRSLAMALEIERMIREGRCEAAYSTDPPWSAPSA
jgi:hypothetical protein